MRRLTCANKLLEGKSPRDRLPAPESPWGGEEAGRLGDACSGALVSETRAWRRRCGRTWRAQFWVYWV